MWTSATAKIVLYGKGVFTTIAIIDSRPFLWDKHWRRLTNNSERIDLDISSLSEAFCLDDLNRAIQNDDSVYGRARITFFDESLSPLWSTSTLAKTRVLITTGEMRSLHDQFRISVSPYTFNSGSPLAGIKSCNYLENILTLDEAKNRGFDEAVRINENGHVASAAMANLFWLRDGVLYTPSLATGCLAGTTREYLLENLNCREVEVGIGELDAADAIFITSAGLGVVEVAEFGSRRFVPSGHPVKTILPWAN